jgi:small GTP-binding protein
MSDFSEQIGLIEKEIRETPYHKGTEHHIGKLRARLARLKDREIESQIKSKGGGGGGGYAIKKQGDATIVLIGPPSSGKSTLINKLTNAESKVAPYAFTTVSVIPGMMIYKDAYIQILDVPGLIEGARKGKGRGKEVLSVARGADLLIFITDVERPNFLKTLINELEDSGIRINKVRPKVKIDKKIEGGLEIHTNIKQDFSLQTAKEIAQEFGIKNGDVTLKEKVSINSLIDCFSRNRIYIPALFILNKIDLSKEKSSSEKFDLSISAEKEIGLDSLKEQIWTFLNFIRVYLIEDEKNLNFESSIIMKKGQIIADLLPKLGSTFENKYKTAKIWGEVARFPGQEVPLSTKLIDKLQVKLI